jgi:hypothetical protein
MTFLTSDVLTLNDNRYRRNSILMDKRAGGALVEESDIEEELNEIRVVNFLIGSKPFRHPHPAGL